MNLIIETYTFDPAAQTITFGDYQTIQLENILSVVNVTANVVIYNPQDKALGGSVATNVLTLDYPTPGMADTDELMITYFDPNSTGANVASGAEDSGNPVKVGGVYNATAPTLDDGDRGDLQLDANGSVKVTKSTLDGGEDLIKDTQGVTHKPVVSATYSGTAFTNYGAATNANVRAAAGQLLSIHAQNENAAVRYLQIFNLAAAPTEDSSVPIFSFAIPAGSGTVPGVLSVGKEFFGAGGYYLSTGFSWGISVDPDVFDANAVTAGEHQINGILV